LCSSGSSLADALLRGADRAHGVGPFGVAFWLVFCKDQGHHQDSSSKGGEPLAPFVAWRKRAAKAAD